MTETLAHGYSSASTQRELSNEYQHDRVLDGSQKLLRSVLWTRVASALEWVNPSDAEVTFIQCARMKKLMKVIKTTPCGYSLEGSRRV